MYAIRSYYDPAGGGVEVIEAQTSEQLNVTLEVSILFQLDGSVAPSLYQRLGSEQSVITSYSIHYTKLYESST